MPDLLASLQDVLGDRYQLEGELGHGGMATVYRATDRKLGRAVAIKVLQPELALILGGDRFRREIDIATRLQHPNIVPLFDSGGHGELLYYIMPLISGETLRERLERETQLGLDEALRIIRDVADGVGYAHSQGIVHRDIKPENILLSSGRVYVADFGIARAIDAAGEDRLTSAGIVLGTPAYMSPEQAGGRVAVDGRADVYAMGCVLYEMLAGRPPFAGATAQAVLAQQLSAPVPSLRIQRDTVPGAVEMVIIKALAKVPADRFETALRMRDALDRAATGGLGSVAPAGIGSLTIPGVLLLLVLGIAWWKLGPSRGTAAGAAADTTRYVVLPFERGPGVPPDLAEDQLVRDALARWSGITIPDQFQVREAIGRAGPQIDSRVADRIALQLGAARYIRGDVTRVGDSLRIHAAVLDARQAGVVLHQARATLGLDLSGVDSLLNLLADSLLLPSLGSAAHAAGVAGTRSVPAFEEYARGHHAIEGWDLSVADSAFASAVRYDGQYASALLWLALVRSWIGDAPATWMSAAQRASANRDRLPLTDQRRLDAVLALGRAEIEQACSIWSRQTRSDPHDFAAWYSLANCLVRDSIVVRDASSRSGWRFRSSYSQAVNAFQRAFEILPGIHRSLGAGSYAAVRRLLFTDGGHIRLGHALAPDTTSFLAYPAWQVDSLAFVPYPRSGDFAPDALPSATAEAIRHERERFRQIATSWVTEAPGSAEALEALAIAVDMLDDSTALDTLRHARKLVTSGDDAQRLAVAEVWMRLRYALPADGAGLRQARALADSVLRAGSGDPVLLACLAALTGRTGLAAGYMLDPRVSASWDVPGPLRDDALPLLMYASLGGPVDSIRALEGRTAAAVERLPRLQQAAVRTEWLGRAAALAFPVYRFPSLSSIAGTGDPLLDAQFAFTRGDTTSARRRLDAIESSRRSAMPEILSFDALAPEAALLRDMGDNRRAAAHLDPTLEAIGRAAEGQGPIARKDPVLVGALIQALVLRAELAARMGDAATARRWALPVAILWSDADSYLRPIVSHMTQLSR